MIDFASSVFNLPRGVIGFGVVTMDMTIKTSARSNVLYVSAAGDFALEMAARTFLEVIDSVRSYQSDKVLFDGRDISGDPTIIERFYYGEFAADAVRRRNQGLQQTDVPKFAYVLLPPVLDHLRLGETVAVNRGMNVKAFDNINEAIEWLALSPDAVEFLNEKSAARDGGP